MQVKLYNQKGEVSGNLNLPDSIFNVPWNADLVHQMVIAQSANQRHTIAATKDRREVSGGGRKPWRQKHTGRARHGSIRSPLWRGGGVSHGPKKEKVFSQKINQKMKQRALACVLSAKLRDGELLVLEDFNLNESKTKSAHQTLHGFLAGAKQLKNNKKSSEPKTLLVLPQNNRNVVRAVRNLAYATVLEASQLSLSDVLSSKLMLLPQAGVDVIKKRLNTIK